MAKLTKLLKESIDQHKRKVYLKAAIDMATSYSRRGYTQDEAIKDAAQGIKNVYGYELTPQDIEAIKHFVPVNAQFKEIVVKPTKAYHYCILGGVDENIIGFKDVLNKEDFRKSVIRARKQNPNFKFAFDWLNDNEPFFAEPYPSQDPSFRNDDEISEPDEIMTFNEWATTVVNSDRIPSYLTEIVVKATQPNNWESFEKYCTYRLAPRLKMDDMVSVIEVAGRDDDNDLGIQTVREALRLFIERCKEEFEDDIDIMMDYWDHFTSNVKNVEDLAERTIEFIERSPIWYDLMVHEELGFELHSQGGSGNTLGEIVVKPSKATLRSDSYLKVDLDLCRGFRVESVEIEKGNAFEAAKQFYNEVLTANIENAEADGYEPYLDFIQLYKNSDGYYEVTTHEEGSTCFIGPAYENISEVFEAYLEFEEDPDSNTLDNMLSDARIDPIVLYSDGKYADTNKDLSEIVVKPSGDVFKEDVANFIDDILSYMKKLDLSTNVLRNGGFIPYIENFAEDLPDELDADDETRKRFDELWYDKIIPLARKNRSNINTLEDYIQFFEKAKKL